MKMIRLLLALSLAALNASASVLTNADVIKMSTAKLDDAIILTSIENSEPKFDTSPQGLIDLSAAKVSQPIIAAMIKRGNTTAKKESARATPSASTAPAVTESPKTEGELMSPSEVFLVDGDETKAMRYINPQMRTAARGMGFGGIASYAVLRGDKATERIKNAQPSFLVSVPNQAQPESYLTLASFAVRTNNTREVSTGGGYMSYSSGIHPDRVVAVNSEKAADQSKAQKGFTIYKVTAKRAMPIGEYAVILYTGEMQGVVGTWFTSAGNAYFDFGVDH